MRRIYYNSLAAVSAGLFVGVVVLSLRSISMGDYLRWGGNSSVVELASGDGLFSVGWGEVTVLQGQPETGWTGSLAPFYQSADTHQINLRRGALVKPGYRSWSRRASSWSGSGEIVLIPYWLLALCLGILPLLWMRKWLRGQRRRRSGLCPTCGYDLRASKGHCPECGTTIRRFYR